MYKLVTEKLGQSAIVIDADDLLNEPGKTPGWESGKNKECESSKAPGCMNSRVLCWVSRKAKNLMRER